MTALFQIVRDALDNVARHSRARGAVVALEVDGGVAVLSMRERAAAIGARLRVASHPGRGTEVSIRVRA